MVRGRTYSLPLILLAWLGIAIGQTPAPPKQSTPPPAAKKAAAPAAMTNQDVIRLVKAKVSDDLVVAKINQSKTRFDTSVDALVALKEAGVSDTVVSAMMNAGAGSSSAPPKPATSSAPTPAGAIAPAPAQKSGFGASNVSRPAAATNTNVAARKGAPPRPVEVSSPPPNYGVYIWSGGGLKPLGQVQTKVQISKFRSLLKSIPFVRQKIDINIPGAHSTSRFEETRPTFFAYFPPSRDVSKFKLLQCKITGQRFDQRTLANASILFSTEQNQDEVPVDIGPTSVKDLYRLFPREDIPSGEFGFVEGNTGSQSASNIEILDVYDFAIDRKEDKMSLQDYLKTLPPADLGDTAFRDWSKEECQRIVAERSGKVGLTGSMLAWFKGQYASLDVYWADAQFARAFARLEMLDKNLSAADTDKLAAMLLSPDNSQYYVMVSVGTKIGSGKLIGANEGERTMRPFDASLADEKSKDVVPAKHLDFVGGYAGLWKVAFAQQSIRGPVLQGGTQELVFEARLNQNLEFKATFPTAKISSFVNGTTSH